MMKILFAENHARFAAITVKTFLSAHSVTVVPSLELAREALTASAFDVVLLDYDLDDGKGADLVEEMRDQSYRAVVIATSSHAEGNQALRDAGADAVCAKMDFKNIEAVIAAARTTCRNIAPSAKSLEDKTPRDARDAPKPSRT